MAKILVVAPHPDDELLGCGGTILRHIADGDDVYWLIVTDMSACDAVYSSEIIGKRRQEIEHISQSVNFKQTIQLAFPPAGLNDSNKGNLIAALSSHIHNIKPKVIYLPHVGDIHTDHKYVAEATISACKSFRAPFIKELLAYETISETDYAVASPLPFIANSYVNISEYLDRKVELLKEYESEIHAFPFPRSEVAIRALAQLRGSQCNSEAAEAFMLLKRMR